MNPNHTDITIVLDRSGSMRAVANDTIGGFNRFLEDQQKAPGTATLTLHQFDTVHETPIPAQDILRVSPLTSHTFVPRGSTALLDAMGRAVLDTGRRLDSISERDRAGKVVFVVITDGEENASHEFTRSKIFDLIKHQQEKYSWQFVFLGANQDAIKAGTSFGFVASNAMSYAANSAGSGELYRSISCNLREFRTGTKASMSFEKKDREAQTQAGAAPDSFTEAKSPLY